VVNVAKATLFVLLLLPSAKADGNRYR